MAEVALKNVTKVYPGDVSAVKDFSLSVGDGEFVVLVGPSGCGKSTTLRMVAGLEEVTGGTIHIADRVVNDVPPKDRDIAMVFQNYALYPHMTVYKNMAFALKLRKFPKAEIDSRVRAVARTLGIEELLGRKPKALSGGQRQRVAVGRAIVRQPAAFLFDEPLSNLDAKLRVEMRGELKRLHQQLGRTTLYVTHDQEEAMTLGDRIAVMADGACRQVGAPLEVYSRPADRFVAGFVGTPGMNFLDGRIVRDDGLWFDGAGFRLQIPPQRADGLDAWIDRAVVLGVRPEAVALTGEGRFAGPDNAIPVTVNVVEPLGEKMDLFCATAAAATPAQLVARVEAQPGVAAGDTITLHVDASRLHIFAPDDEGKNLTVGAVESA